jgi:hypothetical protein
MALVKKHNRFGLPALPVEAAADRTPLWQALLYTLYLAHVLLGITWSFYDPAQYQRFIIEDGYIEQATALILLATSILCLYRAFTLKQRLPVAFYAATALLFFFGFGEEISWGQRIFGFGTPEELQKINTQQEFNFHNIYVGNIHLNQLIFGLGAYTLLFIYFLLFPVLYRLQAWFRKWVDRLYLPIPTTLQSVLYTLSFFSLLLIQEDRKWEMQEFALAGCIFLTFLLPFNRSRQNKQY